jgi:hypothetical protein
MYEHLPEYLAAIAPITVRPGPGTAFVCGSTSGLLVWGSVPMAAEE